MLVVVGDTVLTAHYGVIGHGLLGQPANGGNAARQYIMALVSAFFSGWLLCSSSSVSGSGGYIVLVGQRRTSCFPVAGR
jgi:hypothetical protein